MFKKGDEVFYVDPLSLHSYREHGGEPPIRKATILDVVLCASLGETRADNIFKEKDPEEQDYGELVPIDWDGIDQEELQRVAPGATAICWSYTDHGYYAKYPVKWISYKIGITDNVEIGLHTSYFAATKEELMQRMENGLPDCVQISGDGIYLMQNYRELNKFTGEEVPDGVDIPDPIANVNLTIRCGEEDHKVDVWLSKWIKSDSFILLELSDCYRGTMVDDVGEVLIILVSIPVNGRDALAALADKSVEKSVEFDGCGNWADENEDVQDMIGPVLTSLVLDPDAKIVSVEFPVESKMRECNLF